MKHENPDDDGLNRAESTQDDLGALSRLVSLPALGYQDIGRQQQLAAIVERWPLLDELSLASDAEDPCR
ncbi:cellulose biosynthesis protein BcsR [Zobellella maritima]|uniref:cellulose biosynthesis protein BcsR n=1 Tax=Zobellella maritima TaxID=2059725 RepID=UPI000E30577D|nr:cellulose biosynthesis protein BcsR [Zobellella maritima]